MESSVNEQGAGEREREIDKKVQEENVMCQQKIVKTF